jgi:hypothetical protein
MKRMLSLSLMTILLLNAPLSAQNDDKADFAKIQQALVADAKRVFQSQTPENDWDRELRNVKVSADQTDEYLRALQMPVPPEEGPYVVSYLLRPLLASEKDVIAKAIPIVERVFRMHSNFLALPKLSPGASKAITPPDYASGKRDDLAMRQMMLVIERRNQALQRYERIRQHNIYAEELAERYTKLKIRSGARGADKDVISLIKDYEQKGVSTFAKVVSTVGDESGNLDKERAKAYYDLFVEIGKPFKYQEKEYFDPGDVGIQKSGQAFFGEDDVNVGVLFLEAADDLAKKNSLPRIDVPTRKELREYRKKMRDRRRNNRRRNR